MQTEVTSIGRYQEFRAITVFKIRLQYELPCEENIAKECNAEERLFS